MKRNLLRFMILSVMSLFALGASAQTPDYLCFTAEEANSTVALNKITLPTEVTIEYQVNGTDEGSWISVDFSSETTTGDIPLTNVDDKVYFRNAANEVTGFSISSAKYYQFSMSGKIAASGNVMSLVDKTCKATEIPDNHSFDCLFSGCTGLTTAPSLPATTLKDYCYYKMFYGCTSLTTAPELPATTLGQYCYYYMFRDCTSLTIAPELPATTFKNGCYNGMFKGCTSLTTAPELPATTLVSGCYNEMFSGCTKLNYISVGFTEWGNSATRKWVEGVSSTGTFICPEGLSKTEGTSNIPSGWAVNKLIVNVSSIGWASLYYNKALEIPTGVQAYYASAASGSTVTLTEITGVIPANTAVIFSAAEGEVQFPLYTDTAPDAIEGNLFEGVLAETTNPGDVYVLDGNATTTNSIIFNNYTGATLGARKAYLPKSALSSSAKDINFVFEGEATSIDRVDVNGQQSTVNSIFNLAGQKVGADYKGIVIVNGKKFIKK